MTEEQALLTNPVATAPGSEFLLQHRELVSIERSLTYLVSRLRTRTPLGASEFLMIRAPAPAEHLLRRSDQRAPSPDEEREAYDHRCSLALRCMAIYRQVFPDHYARSTAPLYSIQREQQFYRLINEHGSFPLEFDSEHSLDELLERDPNSFMPFIPVCGKQKFAWQPGLFEFEELPIPFQLAVTLGWVAKDNEAWQTLVQLYDLDKALPDGRATAPPAPPLAAVGWTQFVYSCHVEDTPLKWLPLAFDMISYKTGNVWLDLPAGVGAVGFEWSLAKVMELSIAWAQAKDIALTMTALDNWFAEDPPSRIAAAIRRWNEAARVEVQSGYAGMLPQDLIEAGAARLVGRDHRGLLVAIPHQLLEVPEHVEFLRIGEGAVEFEEVGSER